jgi:tryptophan synthase alpha chain
MVNELSKLAAVFQQAKSRNEAALIPYITSGYPDIATNEALILELFRSGADIVEIGIPFSDPLADGATIQRAGAKALEQGVTVSTCLEIAGHVRDSGYGPIVLMGYYNSILNHGLNRFAIDCRLSGIAGLIVPDLPPEEAGELRSACSANGVDLVFLLAPTSTEDRIRLAAGESSGFVYCVSVTGVTGSRASAPAGLEEFLLRIRICTSLPLAVGFGISTPPQARSVAKVADGVIVGSALIDTIDRANGGDCIAAVRDYIREMKSACTGA